MLRSILCFAILQSCTGAKNIPVLLMDHDNVMSHISLDPNPFSTVKAEFFTDLILDAMKRTDCVIIFTEETLCTEDISMRDKFGTPFHYLHEGIQDRKALYLPSVSEPYKLLRQILDPQPFNSFHLGFGEKLRLTDHYYKHLYIYFQDAPKVSRSEALRKHDMIMKEVYFIVRQLKTRPVVAFYTGKVNPVQVQQLRYLPETEKETPKERGVMIATPDALFRLNGVFSSIHTRRSSFDQPPEVEVELRTRRTLNTTMQYSDFHLQFNFEFEEKDWKLANVVLLEAGDEVGRTETAVSAPWERSYYCAEPITIFNKRDGSFITLSEYQIEPLSDLRRYSNRRRNYKNEMGSGKKRSKRQESEGGGEGESGGGGNTGEEDAVSGETSGNNESGPIPPGKCSFSRHISCGPYFNIQILAALFIFMMFMVICMWGVLMLFNCGSNSKFDDPNQKPLVIAQEAGGG